jgi:hypothetical protein
MINLPSFAAVLRDAFRQILLANDPAKVERLPC